MKGAGLLTTIACLTLVTPLCAQDQKKQDPMQCCMCCMKNKQGDAAKADDAAKKREAELNKLIDEFKEAPQDRKLGVLSALLSKFVEQRKVTEGTEHDHSAH